MLCVDLMTIFCQGRDPFIQGFMKSAFRSITVASFGLVLLEMALSVDFVENGLEKLLLLVVEKVKRARWDGRDRNMWNESWCWQWRCACLSYLKVNNEKFPQCGVFAFPLLSAICTGVRDFRECQFHANSIRQGHSTNPVLSVWLHRVGFVSRWNDLAPNTMAEQSEFGGLCLSDSKRRSNMKAAAHALLSHNHFCRLTAFL